jgi:hypothetical protein
MSLPPQLAQPEHRRDPDSERSKAIGRILEFFLRWTGVLLGLAFLAGGAYLYDIQHVHNGSSFLVFPEIFLAEIGSVLLAVSLLHLGYEHGLRDSHLDTTQEALRRVLDGRSGLNSLGVRAGWDSIPGRELKELFESASTIRVLKTFHPEEFELEAGLQHALGRASPATVEFLLCEIDSKLLEERCEAAGEPRTEGKHKNSRLVLEVSKWIENQAQSTCSVAFYDAWPGPPLIACDDRLFVGFYLWEKSSLSSPWLEIDPATEFGKDLCRQFAIIKGRAKVTLNDKKDFEDWLKANPVDHIEAA